ncbi:MAG: hypothetical protein LBU65_12725 [Planctomycetaceae bacterium]|nr:hypothetical protein [Planctomycetaceae bacterium]
MADIVVDGVLKKDSGYYGSNYGDYTLNNSAGTVVVDENSTLTSWATIDNLITEDQTVAVESHSNIKNLTIGGGHVYNYQNIGTAVVNRGSLGNGGWDTNNNAGSPITGATVSKVILNGGSVINFAHSESIGPYERGQIDSVVINSGNLTNYGYVKEVEFYSGRIILDTKDSQSDR